MKKLSFLIFLIYIFWSSISYSQTIRITNPRSGSIWYKGNTYTITWTATGSMNVKVKIRLYQGDTKILGITDSTANNGSYAWTIPTSLVPGNYYIRVKTIDNKVFDDSDVFTITNSIDKIKTITVIYPNGGERIAAPGTLNVRWKSTNDVKKVKIIGLFYQPKTMKWEKQQLAETIADVGLYKIPIGEKIYDSKDYKIRIEDSSDSSIFDESDGNFEIYHTNKPMIKLLKPMHGDIYYFGDRMQIKWKAVGFDLEVVGELWKGNTKIGRIISDVTADEAEGGYKYWEINDYINGKRIQAGDDYYIKIIAKNKTGVEDKSGKFSIKIKEDEKTPFIERISPTKVYPDGEIKVYGRNFHTKKHYAIYVYSKDSSYFTDVLEWKPNFIRFKIRKKDIKTGFYKVGIERLSPQKGYNKVLLEIIEKLDIAASNCGYQKNTFTTGEYGTFSIFPVNKGNATILKYKITAWSVYGKGDLNLSIRGKSFYMDTRKKRIKSGATVADNFKLKIKDSPGDYTLFIKVEAIEPFAQYDINKNNNICKIRYKVIHKYNQNSLKIARIKRKKVSVFSLPDLTFDKTRTKILSFNTPVPSGIPHFLEAVVKNLNYKTAKLPLPSQRKIYVKIIDLSNRAKKPLEMEIPTFAINELNNKGESDFISKKRLVALKAKIIVDSKNSIKETQENNNQIIVGK
jgi:hypothetical protein